MESDPSPGPFRNLMGLETEYVIKYSDYGDPNKRPTDELLFRRLARGFKKSQPVIKAVHEANYYFAANGGALSFEGSSRLDGTGLIEGATPECYSPRDLLIAQRAQDQLLSQAAKSAAFPEAEFLLLKNNRDKNGNTYGCHENYEATFATGIRLRIWQATIILLYPFIILGWVALIPMALVLVIISFLLGTITYIIASRRFPNEDKQQLRKKYLWTLDEPGIWTVWNVGWVYLLVAPTLFPSVLIATAVARFVAFHPTRKTLVKFLVTRPSWSGAGWLDQKNSFFIQQKPAKCLIGEGTLWHRPIFHIANLVKCLIGNPLDLKQYKSLLRSRQRLQIAFSDSNMCEEAEYLKLATTRLLIDALEAGAIKDSPTIRRPLWVARKVCRGILKKPIASFKKQKLDAIQVQQFFYHELYRFHAQSSWKLAEIDEIFVRWNSVLRGLELDRQSLVGRVDWVTKRFLLDELDCSLSVAARRKVDLKYHELSPEGYYFRLFEAGVIEQLVTAEEIEKAKRLAPEKTRAAIRGRYIREFSGARKKIKMNWDKLTLGAGKNKRIIKFPREE